LAIYGVRDGQLLDRRKATMPTVVYIGDKLKEVRTRRLLTQIELADKASVNHSTIVNIERNQVEPHFRTIRKLANALDVDPTELLGE
jgi:transcriptional regulator with XRE-family HTH domain